MKMKERKGKEKEIAKQKGMNKQKL